MKSVSVVDLSSVFWRYWHASAESEVSGAKMATINLIASVAADHDICMVAIDSPPYKRCETFPNYKSSRDHDELAIGQLRETIKELNSIGVQVIGVPGYEADDVIATISKKCNAEGHSVYVLGTDKDLLQIPNITIVNMDRKELTPEEKFGVSCDKVADFLAIVGDRADDVPGVPGFGPKRATQLLEKCESVENIISGNADLSWIPEKARNVLESSMEDLAIAKKLVTLKDDLDIKLSFENTVIKPKTCKIDNAEEKLVQETQTLKAVKVDREVIKADPRNAQWSFALEPNGLNEAFKIAKICYESRLFGNFENPQAIFSIILRGRSLGLDATTALSSFHVVEGKPTMHASLIVGLVLRSGYCEYFDLVESTSERAVYETKRRGARRETIFEYTIKEAEEAGLLRPSRSGKKTNWQTRPKTMLRHRCATELARAVYPDITVGLYTPDEIEEVKGVKHVDDDKKK